MSTLPKIDIQRYRENLKGDRTKLLEQASHLLGYRVGNPHSLLNQLISCDMAPFKTSSVTAYMKSKQYTGLYSGTRNWILWLLGNVLALPFQFLWFKAAGMKDGSTAAVALITFLILLAAATGVSIMGLILNCDTIGTGSRRERTWVTSDISQYESVIPDFVLNKALTLKSNIPSAVIKVAYLVERYSSIKPLPDPFLLVLQGYEQYYVEQWDEKDLPKYDE